MARTIAILTPGAPGSLLLHRTMTSCCTRPQAGMRCIAGDLREMPHALATPVCKVFSPAADSQVTRRWFNARPRTAPPQAGTIEEPRQVHAILRSTRAARLDLSYTGQHQHFPCRCGASGRTLAYHGLHIDQEFYPDIGVFTAAIYHQARCSHGVDAWDAGGLRWGFSLNGCYYGGLGAGLPQP